MNPQLAQIDLPLRLTLVIHTLCRVIAARAGRDRAVAPTVLLTWPYLMRLAKRFAALVRRVRAGAVAPSRTSPRARPRARPRATPAACPHPPRPPRLPGGFAWLIRMAPEAAPLGGQLQALLADPDCSALLEASPQAGRLLRPLCHMLGLRPGPDLPPALFQRPARPPSPGSGPPAETTPDITLDTGGSGTGTTVLAGTPSADPPPHHADDGRVDDRRIDDDPRDQRLLTERVTWRPPQ